MTVNWKEILGWSEDQLSELRFSGFSYLREGKYDKALLFFEALVILNPNSLYDRQTLGALYVQTNDATRALKHLNKAISIDTTHEPTLINKVKALIMNGDIEPALKLATQLKKSADQLIANDAQALILAHA